MVRSLGEKRGRSPSLKKKIRDPQGKERETRALTEHEKRKRKASSSTILDRRGGGCYQARKATGKRKKQHTRG